MVWSSSRSVRRSRGLPLAHVNLICFFVSIFTLQVYIANIIEGGVESQGITEAFGEFRTGKTQLSHTLCVTAQLSKSQGGGEGKVLYIDTENTFRPERIKQIAARYNLDPEQVLNNIMVGRAFTVDAVNTLILQAAAAMIEDQFALMIIDSIMAPYRVDYSGRGELAER